MPLFLNFLIFQLGWFVCITADSSVVLIYTVCAVLIHRLYVVKHNGEIGLLLLIAMMGLSWDILLIHLHILQFSASHILGAPYWLAALWIIFASTFNACLKWLQLRLKLAAVLGATCAPLSYFAGAQLSDGNTLGQPLGYSLGFMALGWAVIFPFGLFIARSFRARYGSSF